MPVMNPTKYRLCRELGCRDRRRRVAGVGWRHVVQAPELPDDSRFEERVCVLVDERPQRVNGERRSKRQQKQVENRERERGNPCGGTMASQAGADPDRRETSGDERDAGSTEQDAGQSCSHAGVRVSRHRRDRAGAQREQDQGDTHQRAQAAPNQVQQPDELDVLAHVIAIRTSTEIGEAEEASR